SMMETQEPVAREAPAPAVEPREEPAAPEKGAPAPKPPEPAPRESARPPLFRAGNPLRWVRGGVPMVVASLLTVLLIGHEGQFRWGVPIGIVLVAIASWSAMDLLGTFDDPDERVAAKTTIAAIGPSLATLVGASLVFCLTLGFGVAGVGMPPLA